MSFGSACHNLLLRNDVVSKPQHVVRACGSGRLLKGTKSDPGSKIWLRTAKTVSSAKFSEMWILNSIVFLSLTL